jgi:uncharacterized PurR-regulated membrane protein YhhQ (DUF165 family)
MKPISYCVLTLFLLTPHTRLTYAQSNAGKVVVSGHVSRIVALSVAPESLESLAHAVRVASEGVKNLTITLSGSGKSASHLPVK